jgi:hypothetical protein
MYICISLVASQWEAVAHLLSTHELRLAPESKHWKHFIMVVGLNYRTNLSNGGLILVQSRASIPV